MFILNSIGIFVKLIQEYRGGAYIYSGGKGLNHQIHVMTHFKNQFKMIAMNNN